VKTPYLSVLIAAFVAFACVVAAAPALQATQSTPSAQDSNQPKNLQVLSKDLTLRQVKEIMDDWTDALGVDCGTCHVRDAAHPLPNGRPRYDFADDSKQEKKTARVMYAMTGEINARYVSTVPNSGVPVNCGTCHRGHLSPSPFSSADESAPTKTDSTAKQ
jgi:hypothetical protein